MGTTDGIKFGDERLPERFWSKVRPNVDGCWMWYSAKTPSGYGKYGEGRKKQWQAHRLIWERLVGPIGELQVLHRCDVPGCVNPAHLWLGTQLDNIRDMVEKGRYVLGKRQIQDKCFRGHPLVEGNLYRVKGQKRGRCATCTKILQGRSRRVWKNVMACLGLPAPFPSFS